MSDKPYHHGDLRSALLAAGEAELTERGIEGFSLRSVAKRAGVSHAAPAHHFGDVQGLLTALRREVGATDARDRAVRAGLGYMEFAVARPALFRLIFSSKKPDFSDPEMARAAEAAYHHLVGLIEALGGGPADVTGLWAMSHGLADLSAGQRMRSLLGTPEADRQAIFEGLLERVLPR